MPAGVVAAYSRYQPRLFEHDSEYSTSTTDVNKAREKYAESGHKVSAAVNGSRKRCLSFCQADSPG
jgi:hypothetical protein